MAPASLASAASAAVLLAVLTDASPLRVAAALVLAVCLVLIRRAD